MKGEGNSYATQYRLLDVRIGRRWLSVNPMFNEMKSPFGSLLPGRSYSSNSYKLGFNGQEKDDEVKGSRNSYDFGQRMMDPRLGRSFSTDRLYMVYPGISPYSLNGNSPTNAVDVNGDLVIFVNGSWGTTGLEHQGECHIELEQYWDVEVRKNAAATFNDYQAAYFNGSNVLNSSANTRYSAGKSTGALYAMHLKGLLDKQRLTDPNAVLNFVSHSMGGSFSAGLIDYLSKATYPEGHANAGKSIFAPADFGQAYFLAPYQPTSFTAPTATTNTQMSHIDDYVAGYEKIKNIGKNYFATNSKTFFKPYAGPHLNATFAIEFPKSGGFDPLNIGGAIGSGGHDCLDDDYVPKPKAEVAPRDNTKVPNPRNLK